MHGNYFIILNCCNRSRDNSVGIAMGYRLDSQGLVPERGKRFLCSPQHPDSCEILPIQLRHSAVASIVCYWSPFTDVASGIESGPHMTTKDILHYSHWEETFYFSLHTANLSGSHHLNICITRLTAVNFHISSDEPVLQPM
jgi:hypothetical protein